MWAQEILAPLEKWHTASLIVGVYLGNTGCKERPSGARLLERNSEEVVGSGARSRAGACAPRPQGAIVELMGGPGTV